MTKTPLLPHQSQTLFVTDGGMETDLIFNKGIDLPHFASFVLLENAMGEASLRQYYEQYVAIAHKYNAGLVLESPTWRANTDWGALLGYDEPALAKVNQKAIAFLQEIRAGHDTVPMVISGCIGPRGDGYSPQDKMNAATAADYHTPQIAACQAAGADFASALTMTYTAEAIGIIQAGQALNMPIVISFTLETDGCLPSGQSLQAAIEEVNNATGGPAYYMLNCAHPSHFQTILTADAAWASKIHGIRANASKKSHAELDESTTLDEGNPQELGNDYGSIKARLPQLNVIGGCCGTDYRHVDAMVATCTALGNN